MTVARVDDELRPFIDDDLPDDDTAARPALRPGMGGRRRRRIPTHRAGGGRPRRTRERIGGDRRAVADGITEEQYGVTLAVLERMARNLGWQ